jgi:serine/threonine-protein kinase
VAGQDAEQLVNARGPLPVPAAVGMACQMLKALEYAHAQQYVHRDVKPANLLVSREKGHDVVRLADFGLARVYQDSVLSGLTLTGDVGGSAGYMAPEQIHNFREVLPAADQYSAAATLYFLLTGQHIYNLPRERHRQVALVLNEEPIPIRERRAELPAALAAIIHQGLARDPASRFADIATLRKALAPFLPL